MYQCFINILFFESPQDLYTITLFLTAPAWKLPLTSIHKISSGLQQLSLKRKQPGARTFTYGLDTYARMQNMPHYGMKWLLRFSTFYPRIVLPGKEQQYCYRINNYVIQKVFNYKRKYSICILILKISLIANPTKIQSLFDFKENSK